VSLPLTQPRWRYLALSGVILGLALWLRVHDLYNLPIFFDESSHIDWAIRFATNNPGYPFLMDGKFFLGVFISLFQLNGPAALWLGRAAIGLAGLLSCAASIGLANKLAGRGAGLLAGLAYALLPQAILFERQVLADPLMSALGLLMVVIAYRLAHRWDWRLGVAFAIALAACVIAKLFGLIYLAFPLFIVLFLTNRSTRWPLALRYTSGLVLAAVVAGLFLLSLWPRLGYNDNHLASQQIGFVGCPPVVCGFNIPAQANNLKGFVGALNEEALPYYGWPILLLAVLAVPLALPTQRRPIGVFALASLAMLVGFGLTAKGYVPPRYMIFMAAPFTILAGVAVAALSQRLTSQLTRNTVWGLTTAAILIWPGLNGLQMAVTPAQAQMTNLDRQGFYWPSTGQGIRDAAQSLRVVTVSDPPPVVLVGHLDFSMVAAYFDRSRINVRPLGETQPADLGQWLLNGQPIYLFDAPDQVSAKGLHLQSLGVYPQIDTATVGLSRITGLGPDARAGVYQHVFIEPEKLTDNYKALIESLPTSQPITLLVYPPNHAPTLAALTASQPNLTITPIGDSWPLDTTALDTELQSVTQGQTSVRVVFSEETKGDPTHTIESWLDTHLFHLDETWFGPVRTVGYAGTGPVTQTVPVVGKFGDAIQLDSVEVLDSAPTAGGLVRLRLTWHPLALIPQQYKVFTHIFAGDYILAQHDGQPVGELRPTNTWQVSETIVDQFAIQLPPDAQPGDYQLRIGVYDLNTQARLPLTLPDGTQAEFFVGVYIKIK